MQISSFFGSQNQPKPFPKPIPENIKFLIDFYVVFFFILIAFWSPNWSQSGACFGKNERVVNQDFHSGAVSPLWIDFFTIWTPFWIHFNTILIPFWLYFDTILTLFGLHFDTRFHTIFWSHFQATCHWQLRATALRRSFWCSSEHVTAGDARDESKNERRFRAARVVACEGPVALASDSQTETPMNAKANEVASWESDRWIFPQSMSVFFLSPHFFGALGWH